MHEALFMLARAIAAPAAVSLIVALLLNRLLLGAWRRYAAAVAFAAGYCAGFALLRPWDELLPSRHWQWTFYIALAAAALGPISAAAGIHRFERWVLIALPAFVAAWLLVPDWVQPPRAFWMPLLTGYLFALPTALDPVARVLPARNVLGFLTIAAGGNAALIAVAVSLTYGQAAGAAAAALLGCSVALLWSGDGEQVRGALPAYAAIVGGWAFVGCIEPRTELLGLFLAPAAPLALLCCAWGPLARLRGIAAIAAQTTAVAVVLGAAAWLVLS